MNTVEHFSFHSAIIAHCIIADSKCNATVLLDTIGVGNPRAGEACYDKLLLLNLLV